MSRDYRQFSTDHGNTAVGRTELSDLLDRADQILDLLGMRAELFGELVEIGIGDRDKAGLIDIGDDLDADRPQLVLRLMLEFDRFRGLGLVDLVGRAYHARERPNL